MARSKPSCYLSGMRKLLILLALLLSVTTGINAQHCPWDCSGLVVVKTNIPVATLKQMGFVLVDENKKIITASRKGDSKAFMDTSLLEPYDEFVAKRKAGLNDYHWYQYDTAYHFAEGKYLLHFNHCDGYKKKLYLRYQRAGAAGIKFLYIEVPDNKRISLHDFSDELYGRNYKAISEKIKPNILFLDCKKLTGDCEE